MKLFRTTFAATCLFVVSFVWSSAASAVTIHDAKTEIGGTASINGNPVIGTNWKFARVTADGSATLTTNVTNWNQGDWNNQPAWVQTGSQDKGMAKVLGPSIVSFDVQAGDIVGHAPNALVYTVPASDGTGTLNISGNVWAIRSLVNRENAFNVYKNGALLTSGVFARTNWGAGYTTNLTTRAAPLNLTSGTGGAAALQNIAYTLGDVFKLEIANDGLGDGTTSHIVDYAGMNFTLTMTPNAVPEPSSVLLLAIGGIGLTALRRRASRNGN